MGGLDLNQEFRLLLDCTRPGLAPPASVEAALDWPAFCALAERHRVSPLASHALTGRDLPLEALHQRARQSSVRALAHAAATFEVTDCLQTAGIDVLPIKGALLAHRLYGDFGLREVRDVDLLVPQRDLLEADYRLRELGYERRVPACEPTRRRLAVVLERDQHFEYRHRDSAVLVELHWRLEGWSAAALDWLWTHSHRGPLLGQRVRQLSDLAQLLLVVDHGAGHRWFCLKWLADAAALLAAVSDAAVAPLLAAAGLLDATRPLAQAVTLVAELYGTSLAPALTDFARREPLARALADSALEALAGTEQQYFANAGTSGWLARRRYASDLRCRPEPEPRRFALLRPRDFDELPLPDALFFLYYPLRPVLWLRRRLRAGA